MPLFFPPSMLLSLAQTAVAGTTLTGGTGETTLDTISVAAGSIGTNGRISFMIGGTHAGTAGTKTWRVKLGGTTVASIAMATTSGAIFQIWGTIFNVNSQSSQRTLVIGCRGSDALIGAIAESTTAIDTSAAVNITITGQLSAGADSMTRTAYWFDIVKG